MVENRGNLILMAGVMILSCTGAARADQEVIIHPEGPIRIVEDASEEQIDEVVKPEVAKHAVLVKLRTLRAAAFKDVAMEVAAEKMPRLLLKDHLLHATPPGLITPGYRGVKLDGSDRDWVIWAPPNITEQLNFQLECGRVSDAGGPRVWLAILKVAGTRIDVALFGGEKSSFFAAQMVQEPGRFVLYVWKLADGNAVFPPTRWHGKTLSEVRRQAGTDLDRYLGDALTMLGMEQFVRPGATDVYRVFDRIPPDSQATDRLVEVLAAMASLSPQDRLDARQRLSRLGRAELLAAVRLDHTAMGPELRGPVEALLADHSTWATHPAKELRSDPLFMVNCLDDEDARVRDLATRRLAELLKHPVTPPADSAEWAKMRRELREEAMKLR